MTQKEHPIIEHLKATGESTSSFAKRVGISRMQLYRITRGEGKRLSTLKAISSATDGAVSVSMIIGDLEAAE